jgi:hypothetical protein
VKTWTRGLVPAVGLALAVAACGGDDAGGPGGAASATIDGTRFAVSGVQLSFEPGEDGYFRIEGDDAAHRQDDCLPGLGGGMALYGDLPANVTALADLAGRELPFEFSGDGDDFNLCFVGSQGLLGVEEGAVKFAAVEGDRVTFSFSGSFIRYDGEGGESSTPVSASGSGIAQVEP